MKPWGENDSGITVTHNKVLLKIIEVEEKSDGGIVIPRATQDRETAASYVAIVVDAGSTARLSEELEGVGPGDLLVHGKYAGLVMVGRGGVAYRVIRVEDVIGKVDGFYDKRLQGANRMPDNSNA